MHESNEITISITISRENYARMQAVKGELLASDADLLLWGTEVGENCVRGRDAKEAAREGANADV